MRHHAAIDSTVSALVQLVYRVGHDASPEVSAYVVCLLCRDGYILKMLLVDVTLLGYRVIQSSEVPLSFTHLQRLRSVCGLKAVVIHIRLMICLNLRRRLSSHLWGDLSHRSV